MGGFGMSSFLSGRLRSRSAYPEVGIGIGREGVELSRAHLDHPLTHRARSHLHTDGVKGVQNVHDQVVLVVVDDGAGSLQRRLEPDLKGLWMRIYGREVDRTH